MSENKTGSVYCDRHVLGSRETAETHMLIVGGRKDRAELVRRREVDGIIQARVRTDPTLKAACAAIDLSQQLYLEPSLVALCGFRRSKRARQFSDPN